MSEVCERYRSSYCIEATATGIESVSLTSRHGEFKYKRLTLFQWQTMEETDSLPVADNGNIYLQDVVSAA